jgi:hypothetical protein
LSFTTKEKNAKNNNELGGSLLFSTTKAKQLRTMTSRDLNSSSSLAFEEKNKEMTTSLPTCYYLLYLKKKNAKNDNEPKGKTTEAK